MVILINGSINSGKTSVAKALAEKLNKTAHVEVDSLRAFIEKEPLVKAIPINIENTISVAKNFIKNKFNVIISYPLPLERTIQIVNELKGLDNEIYYFSLSPSLETALQDRGNRKLSEHEKERIKYHYKRGINSPGFGIVIDNSKQLIGETAAEVLKSIKEKKTLDLPTLDKK